MIFMRISSLMDSIPPISAKLRVGRERSADVGGVRFSSSSPSLDHPWAVIFSGARELCGGALPSSWASRPGSRRSGLAVSARA